MPPECIVRVREKRRHITAKQMQRGVDKGFFFLILFVCLFFGGEEVIRFIIYLFFMEVLGIEPRTSYVLSRRSTTELYPPLAKDFKSCSLACGNFLKAVLPIENFSRFAFIFIRFGCAGISSPGETPIFLSEVKWRTLPFSRPWTPFTSCTFVSCLVRMGIFISSTVLFASALLL